MEEIKYRDRKNTNSVKWDGCKEMFGDEDLMPLWVADMDFEAPACVKEALCAYVQEGIFGYYRPDEGYYEAFIAWEKMYHDYMVKREWIRFAPGVVPAFNWLIQILTKEQDSVIITPPVYHPFRNAIINNNRKLVESPLVRIGDSYEMNLEDFEKKLVENQVKLFIFCSPHNPVGRVWTREEICQVLDLCKKHNVYVIADEIHQDLVMKGYKKVTAATVGEYDDMLVTLASNSKTFNLAGCQNSFLVIADEKIRAAFDCYTKKLAISDGNAFGYIAVKSAYVGGRQWLEQVIELVERNYQMMKKCIKEAFPDVWIARLEGTYLMWMDLSPYISRERLQEFMQEECKLAIDYGSWFETDSKEAFIRINLATCKENIKEAARRIVAALTNYSE